MSVTVVGHWELSWNTPIKEAELWNFPLRDFGVKNWSMFPKTGIVHNERTKVVLTEYNSFKEMLEDAKGTKVFVEPPNKHNKPKMTFLPDFVHPEECVYIFGSAHLNPTQLYAKETDLGLTIPTLLNNGVLWPHQVLVTILYDRMVKSWE